MPIWFKLLVTTVLIVAISEVAKRTDRLGALLAALPIVTLLAMTWIWLDSPDESRAQKVATHAELTFWYVLPTLPMFLLAPYMLRHGVHYGWVLLASAALTAVCFVAMALLTLRFGIVELW